MPLSPSIFSDQSVNASVKKTARCIHGLCSFTTAFIRAMGIHDKNLHRVKHRATGDRQNGFHCDLCQTKQLVYVDLVLPLCSCHREPR